MPKPMPENPSKTSSMPSIDKRICEHWLNTYSRETYQFDIRLSTVLIEMDSISAENLRQAVAPLGYQDQALAAVYFKTQQLSIIAPLTYFSMGGYHQYEGAYFIVRTEQPSLSVLSSPEQLAGILTAELGGLLAPPTVVPTVVPTVAPLGDPTVESEKHPLVTDLHQKMINSLKNTRYFISQRAISQSTISQSTERQITNSSEKSLLVLSEQHILLGHPFHVISKSCQGFEQKDLDCYSPEVGVSFQLHYFAVDPSLVEEHKLTTSAQVHDRALFEEALQQVPKEYANYRIIPVHPWQAEYLLANPEIAKLLDQNLLLSLGIMGSHVWPTSSVRTLWVPDDRYFLKLPLNVQITNFLRNNPVEHGRRALDVSRALHALPLNLWRSPSFYVVLEEGFQFLKTQDDSLQAATLVIQRQSLCDDYADDAQVLSALLEEDPETAEIPALKLLHSAATHHDKILCVDFIDIWWQQYLRISLLPLLKLFSVAGISLEAHLQNCLLACDKGWPTRFYVRDMEGASIDRECYLERKDACLSDDSLALYTGSEAWFRFKYYVLVNHISHFASCLARTGLTTELRLWSIVDQLLDELSDPAARSWIDDLRGHATLPAKLNMHSCFEQHGAQPSWGHIPNPLYLARKQSSSGSIAGNDPHAYSKLLASDTYRSAQQRVIRQVLEALLYEQAIKPLSWIDNCLVLGTNIKNSAQTSDVIYRCQAVKTASFDRIRLFPDDVIRVSNQSGKTVEDVATNIDTLLNELALSVEVIPEHWQNFVQELLHTALKHSQSFQQAPRLLLKGASTEILESRLSDGHPYHPTFKSRIGFNVADNQDFSPELSSGVKPILLAAKRSCCHLSIIDGLDLEQFLSQELSDSWAAPLEKLGLRPCDYLPIPVHPWQWRNVIVPLYQDSFIRQELVVLGAMDDRYLPQQSIRTLSNFSRPQNCYIKLSMSILNTSTKRLLPAHTICNAAPISAWLSRVVAQDQQLAEDHKPLLLKEVAAIGFTPKHANQNHYGALACIWRQSVYQVNTSEQAEVVPLQALTTLDVDGRPFINDWVTQHGLNAWLKQLIQVVYLPVLHLLWSQGVALEAHAQNMGIQHHRGMPQRAVLKDFHDGVRFNREWLSDKSLVEELTEAPVEHRRINPNSYLEEKNADDLRDFVYDALFFVNLSELAWLLSCHYGLNELDFWQCVAAEIKEYQSKQTDLEKSFSLFNIFTEYVQIEKLASRRFMISNTHIQATNPLYQSRKKPDSAALSEVLSNEDGDGDENRE